MTLSLHLSTVNGPRGGQHPSQSQSQPRGGSSSSPERCGVLAAGFRLKSQPNLSISSISKWNCCYGDNLRALGDLKRLYHISAGNFIILQKFVLIGIGGCLSRHSADSGINVSGQRCGGSHEKLTSCLHFHPVRYS